MQMRSRQRGMGFFQLMWTLGCLALFAIVGAKVFPLYMNQLKLARAVSGTASESPSDIATARRALGRRWAIEDIIIVNPSDIQMERGANNSLALTYDYEARVRLFYNADLVLSFKDSVPVPRSE